MKPLWSSPCSRAGLSPADEPFPCLGADWGDRDCPMNASNRRDLRTREAAMYRIGYTYGAWIVRLDALGLAPLCSLTYFREKPAPGELQARYGNRVLHVMEAFPCPARPGGEPPSDHEVVAGTAR